MNTLFYKNRRHGFGVAIGIVVIALVAVGGFFLFKGATRQREALDMPLPLPPLAPPSAPLLDNTTIIEIGSEDEMLMDAEGNAVKETTKDDCSSGASSGSEAGAVEARPLKEFSITGVPFSFSPNTIKVKKGDFVRIHFTNKSGFHDWVLNEFNIRTAQIPAGSTETVDFVASKAGSFEFYCSVGDHRQKGMVGTFIVEE